MPDQNAAARLSRLLALVPWLLANDGVSIVEAARHFAVTAEQLQNDLYLLIVSGLPGHGPDQLVDIQFWDDGRIHVLDPQTIGRPLRLTGDEATALLVALRLLAQVPGDHDRAALTSLTVRLEAALGTQAHVAVASAAQPGILEALTQAIASTRAVSIVYGAAGSDALTEREIEPISVQSIDGRTYVEAYCRLAGARRTFRLDRIHQAQVVDTGRLDDADDRPSVPPPSVPALVAVDAGADWAAEALGLTGARSAPDGRVLGEVDVRDVGWLVRTVLALGGAAEVLEPAPLRTAVADAARQALAAYA